MYRNLVLVVLVLLLAVPGGAQLITDINGFPAAARGPGLHGTQWVTDLTLFNPMDHPVNLFVAFLPANHDNIGNENLAPLHLEPFETMSFEDAILSLFELDEDIMGLLTITAAEPILNNPEGTVIHSSVRIYNIGSGEGTFGQTVPPLFMATNVGWDSSFITGARNDDNYRSNLGIASGPNPGQQIHVFYTISSSDGTVLAEGSKTIHMLSMGQWSFQQLGVGDVEGPLTVELWLDPEQAAEDPCSIYPIANSFFAYVSKVDNLTGDAEFIYAYPMEPYLCPAE